MFALLAAGLLSIQSACSPPDGFRALLDRQERYIVLGEVHGTVEAPAAFAQMVCAAAERGPVTIALELPVDMQAQLDAFLAADDRASAETALEGSPLADARMNDGRSSQAMLAMMHEVRALRSAGRDVAFHAFQPSAPRPPGLTQAWYELDMGYALSEAFYARPSARVLAIVGSVHARKTGSARFPEIGLPAAAHLPSDAVISLRLAEQGGSAWNCRQACAIHPVSVNYDAQARGLIMVPLDGGAYDGVLALGPVTASPPVSPAP
ncbi:MAG: hypothetical protein IOB84_05880 [Brevundimonas sp.]|nr:hypothetical protein [Brevundimonas sp.]